MAAGKRTAPEVEAEVVRLVREGKTRRQVADATGVSERVVSRVVRDTPGLEFARIGQGSNGTPEGAAKARGYRSEYMRNRREAIADRLLDSTQRSLDLAAQESDPRRYQLLMQAADASMRAYANITKGDVAVSEQESMQTVMSTFGQMVVGVQRIGEQKQSIADQIRASGETDPVKIYGEDGRRDVGFYGQQEGDILRDGTRRKTSLIQE